MQRGLARYRVNMRKLFIIAATLLITACDQQSRGFNLPKGDAEQGRATFILLQCNDCHSVTKKVPWAGEAREDSTHVALGGLTTQVRTYGDLVTSIIHPSHKLSRGATPAVATPEGESKMRTYNEVMSVQELIDLVEFLHPEYEIWVPDYYSYRH